jgi:hypothetical protein
LIVFFTWLLINGNFSCNSVRISIWFWVTFCQNKCWWWCEVKWSSEWKSERRLLIHTIRSYISS